MGFDCFGINDMAGDSWKGYFRQGGVGPGLGLRLRLPGTSNSIIDLMRNQRAPNEKKRA
jgi:hypothetical protein